ncbi:hypothetical protein VK792_15495 [Mesobacterium sp. TK19101]|uniref:Uncharacterized protein n=1 Tax=Mesobacterium hydrothermale TaxID=3111907 RepID=A0ABU6HJS0_9RHOB|nr:hypothetical protein [Mesobacterium sp. TK19101]MEC3862695.1 hypothetical protein [Mesobacterium sp. TK19101]
MKKLDPGPPLHHSGVLRTSIVGPYQGTDRRIVDYGQVMLAGHAFRGPIPDQMYTRNKITFLGAAQRKPSCTICS